MKILIAEDSLMDMQVLTSILDSDDHELMCVPDGLKVFEKIKLCLPDLILLDINMPGMDGYEVCKTLKANKETQNIPVIFLTSNIEVDDEIKGFEIGAVDYIRKPFHEKVAKRRIQTHLSLIQKERQSLKTQKLEAVGTLAGGIAHEFNNLLFTISGNTELLIDSAKPEDKELLQEILNTIKRGSDLIKQLLAFSRKYESNLNTTHLNIEIRSIKTILEHLIPRMITIDLDLEDDLYKVKTDKGLIKQVLMDLCLNARDEMPDGGKLIIKTENSVVDESSFINCPDIKKGECIILSISDTGQGMDKETHEHIFEPFFTTKAIGDGSGLGLSVIYGIIKGHNGTIVCKSELNVGTTFKIYLPAFVGEKIAPAVTEYTVKQPGDKTKILIVDDEESIIKLMRQMLKRSGYETIVSYTGESALDIYLKQNKTIDLILLDLSMPGMGGRKCLDKLIEFDPDVKIIIASGYSDERFIEDNIAAGAKGFVVKPYKKNDLLKIIHDVLGKNTT